ncbi:DUF1642 domain-containing protein [Listeria monocytogenes]|uniref:DUF1642 domain-containing protein n=1 Tax=Listeria monocytogenes TaxID=1639 RepID=UPI000BE107EA|nr:DUF1642 domain-containing protein [Listeria monocytogenes]EAC3224167.1 DUF1642 domain-containing protein [Listeria monocytogenes]EAC7325022.1 DUF1642 domain-containing protein [Listeria monocytogenes]EAC8651821.1 DUF1642 domain-containing protein [Listeria monocytogenes]EAD6879075.1 DUF1642 domain-containing protein [Listeria monocytogenes]EAE0152924.1 DUF1642 domain-containing protein [Listeria monocytogenes]
MNFKVGDRVEFIYRNKKSVGEINGVFPETQILAIKQSDSPVDLLFSDKAVVKVEEQERLVVPQCVADWLNHCKQREYDLACLLDYGNAGIPDEMYEWLISSADNQELLARAWLDGYEVEKEPLYYVKLPISKRNEATDELEIINMCLLLNIRSRETCISGNYRWVDKLKRTGWRTKLTEAQIKDMPEGDIYWQFAVLVEEEEE